MPTYKEIKSTLKPVTEGFRDEKDLPVIPIKLQAEDAASANAHAHPRGQLIYARHGIVRVTTPNGTWLVPPTQAIWLPPNVEHDVCFPGKVTLYSLFISENESHQLPVVCTVLKVSLLLREMILRACDWGDSYKPFDKGYRFMSVLIDEIASAESTKIDLPSAKDARLIRVTEIMAKRPQVNLNLALMAESAFVSPRTLARLFIKEMGMSMGEWNRRLLVQQAIDQLSSGKSVTTVALNLGYKNPTSFIEMFTKSIGMPPAKYMQGRQSKVRSVCLPFKASP